MEKRKPPAAGAGRVKGVPNKMTADIKAMILGALAAQQGGGKAYLQRQAIENPVAFMGLVGKLLPKDVLIDQTLTIIDDRDETEALIRNLTAIEPPMARPSDGKRRIAPVVH